MKKRTLAALLSVFLIAGCNATDDSSKATDKVNVYTTIYPLTFLAQSIGGEHVQVTSIFPNGGDAHHFEPTPKQMMDVAKADVFFYNGLELEPFVTKMVESLAGESVQFVNTSESVPDAKLIHTNEETAHADEDHAEEDEAHHDHEHGSVDPHVWFDPTILALQAKPMLDSLVAAAPDQKEAFEANYEKVIASLNELDANYADAIKNASRKDIFVSHDAYNYIAKRYGLEQISVTGLSPTVEPSQKQLASLVETAKSRGFEYIIFETFATPKVAETIQKELGIETLRMHHIATISKDDVAAGKNYIDLMKENLEVLKKALGAN
ncbi:MAG: metal ABC transporter solute-binding protein, Zn/Mn family [Bacilli bacterium]